MIYKQKTAPRLILAALVTLPLLASCGLRGGLQRPAPILKEAEPKPVAPTVAEPVRESVIIRRNVNEFGGEIPEAAPTEEIGSSPLTEPVIADDEDE